MKLTPRLYFSYSQFFVYDQSVALLHGLLWEDEHVAQGFARRESTISFATLLEFGHADVTVELRPFVPNNVYERVIVVPFTATTGRVFVDGVDETNMVERFIDIAEGHYRLVAAQRTVGDEEEVIDLFFEKLAEPLQHSEVIVADKQLDVPGTLLETAEVA